MPVGLLEVLPPKLQDRPPAYYGRDDLETLMASPNAAVRWAEPNPPIPESGPPGWSAWRGLRARREDCGAAIPDRPIHLPTRAQDWVKITELLLGKAPADFNFVPKHKANAYSSGPIVAEG